MIPLKYESAGDFSEGFAVVERNGKYGYINRKGIVRPILTLAKKFSEGLGAVALIPKGLKRQVNPIQKAAKIQVCGEKVSLRCV